MTKALLIFGRTSRKFIFALPNWVITTGQTRRNHGKELTVLAFAHRAPPHPLGAVVPITYVVGVLADLTDQPAEPLPLRDRKFIQIDRDNFNAVMRGLSPCLTRPATGKLLDTDQTRSIELRFTQLDDFEPAQVVNQVPALRKLLQKRQQLSSLLAKMYGHDRLTTWLNKISVSTDLMQQIFGEATRTTSTPSLIETVISDAGISRDKDLRRQLRGKIATLAEEIASAVLQVAADPERFITARLVAIDEVLSEQLNAIMHHAEFQRLEATWRGLYYLVSQTETSSTLKIRVLNASKSELHKDFETAVNFNQSALFKQVYEMGYGTFGGLIGDYQFDHNPTDVSFLETMSRIAAAAHTPFIAAASPALFNLNSFTAFTGTHDLAKIFGSTEYAKWNRFRESEESRYISLTMPRILLRQPYGPDGLPVEVFNFKEDVSDHTKYLWGNAAYAHGVRLTDAFWKYAIMGLHGGGAIKEIPTHTFPTDEGDIAAKCSTEIAIGNRRGNGLAEYGFIPISQCEDCGRKSFRVAVRKL